MKIQEKLLELKELVLSTELPINRDYEFNATLEEHPIGNQKIYRLYYVNYYRIGENNSRCNYNNVGAINLPCKPFMLPKGMTRKEGFKVLSYLTDFIEKREDIEPCSLKSVKTLDGVLDLERFGFTRVEEEDENKILNLFTVDGILLLFKRSKLYSKYFEWYVENVTLEEVSNIYSKYNMYFKDIIWSDKQNNKVFLECSKVKQLKK